MRITSLEIRDVRNIEHASLKPVQGFNWLFGDNGAGKTSVLESISILSTGRSFRAGKIAAVVRNNQDNLTIGAEITGGESDLSHRLGIQRGSKDTEIRIDGRSVNRISSLARLLPCVIVSTSNHELIEGGPSTRRNFLDWLLFHVEPESLGLFRRYKHALQQRNAALRANASDQLVSMWHPELIATGEKIDTARKELVKKFELKMKAVFDGRGELTTTQFLYKSGWPEGTSLEQAFCKIEPCRRRGVSTVGPHRADMLIKTGPQESRYLLSRGQQKLLAAQMKLMQVEIYSEIHRHGPVVLFDDLPSELDSAARNAVYQYLEDKGSQVFITSVENVSENLDIVSQLFHVKRGTIEKVI